jgi:hypothetical protein
MRVREGNRAAFAFALTIAACVTWAPGAQAALRHVKGTWQNPDPIVIQSLNPVTGEFSATGASVWQGGFRGTTVVTTQGTTNLVTGDTTGTVDETFTGKAGRPKRHLHGTIHFVEEYTVVGATGAFHLVAHMTGGTEGFDGARGTVTFDGTTDTLTGVGGGTYEGQWRLPRRVHVCGSDGSARRATPPC